MFPGNAVPMANYQVDAKDELVSIKRAVCVSRTFPKAIRNVIIILHKSLFLILIGSPELCLKYLFGLVLGFFLKLCQQK